MAFDLEKTYQKLADVHGMFEPDEPNFRRVDTVGGTPNRVGELEGVDEEFEELSAVVWTADTESAERGGAVDEDADLQIRYDEVGFLAIDDVVERISDEKRFRVQSVEDLGGPDGPFGQVASLNEVDDR